jgi:hypothetical protein
LVISYDAAGTPFPAMLFLNRDGGLQVHEALAELRREAWTAERWPDSYTRECQ